MAAYTEAAAAGKAPAKGATPIEENATPEFEPTAHHFENQLLIHGQYADVKENLKSLEDIVYEAPESNFYIQKS